MSILLVFSLKNEFKIFGSSVQTEIIKKKFKLGILINVKHVLHYLSPVLVVCR